MCVESFAGVFRGLRAANGSVTKYRVLSKGNDWYDEPRIYSDKKKAR